MRNGTREGLHVGTSGLVGNSPPVGNEVIVFVLSGICVELMEAVGVIWLTGEQAPNSRTVIMTTLPFKETKGLFAMAENPQRYLRPPISIKPNGLPP